MRRFPCLPVLGRLLLLAFPACSFVEPETPSQEELYAEQSTPNDYFFRGGDGRVINATIGPRSAIGPFVNVAHVAHVDEEEGQALRGVMFGKPVLLSLSPGHAIGLWGAEPMRVEVHRQEKRLHVEGLVRSKITDLWIGPETMTGTIGSCGFDLTRKGPAYEGTSSCNDQIELNSVVIPGSLLAWDDAAFGAMMALLLSR